MSTVRFPAIALVVAATLGAAAAFAEAPIPQPEVSHEAPALPKELAQPQVSHTVTANVEEDFEVSQSAMNSSSGARLSTISPATTGTTLTPPVTITYSGSSDALTINDSGTGRGITSTLTNPGNSNSSIFAQTSGAGAGVKGINAGVNGPGGSFLINNSASAQPALLGATNGTGPGVAGTITKANSNAPAILGTNIVTANYGIGVQGKGNDIGVFGLGSGTSGVGYGVYGYSASGAAGMAGLSSTGIGVFGESSSLYGVFGESSSSIGVYGYSVNSNGVYALSYKADALNAYSTYGRGMTVHSVNSLGIYSSSDNSYGVWGQSKNQFGVIGEDSGTGVGVYGYSASGYAGYFAGKVAATSYLTVSDRNAKTDFAPINGAQVLERVSQLPITSWAFKDDRALRHIGPMAQDFHAAFGLDGDDDKHIALSDAAGVSLAAIQELNKQLKEKDARIAALEGKMKSMNDTFSARLAKLEEQASASPQIMTAYVPNGR